MADHVLYRCAIPADSKMSTSDRISRQTATLGSVTQGGDGQALPISLNPSDRPFTAQYRGQYAEKMARELAELFNGDGFDYLPYYAIGTSTRSDGYYVLESATVEPIGREGSRVWQVSGSLTKEGTQRSRWRGVATNQTAPKNDFGNDTTVYVGIEASATKVRWFDYDSGSAERASPVTTRTAEHGDVAVYDVQNASYDDPHLIYEVPMADEGRVDAKIWDDRGYDAQTDSDGHVQWQRVFQTEHMYEGRPVLDNGLIRLYFDEANGALTAEVWDDATGQWDSKSLGSSNWHLFDVDVHTSSQTSIEAAVEFTDGADYYTLHMSLKRGYNYPQWTRMEYASTDTPSGLVDLLDPIANGQAYDPNADQTVVEKAEVQT